MSENVGQFTGHSSDNDECLQKSNDKPCFYLDVLDTLYKAIPNFSIWGQELASLFQPFLKQISGLGLLTENSKSWFTFIEHC